MRVAGFCLITKLSRADKRSTFAGNSDEGSRSKIP